MKEVDKTGDSGEGQLVIKKAVKVDAVDKEEEAVDDNAQCKKLGTKVKV
ncbi:MAG: hypothetical protein CM1200mP10_12950 [Candidatus Neomarinimicrobiota bacterium]|nr:MAG: hypothetical protein CM1200mP10_12950 [Candidatus Neomarinimicrobiota bacterium]